MWNGWYDRRVRQVRDLPSAGFRIVLELEVRRVACRHCGTVKRERLDFLADNSRFTKRFAFYVGRRCRQASIRDVADELKLDWDTVKTLEMQYMRAQLDRAGTPGPRAIGIDEISVRRGHSYRIVVSDLVRKRPIWFGGEDRSEASMAAFYDWLGPQSVVVRTVVRTGSHLLGSVSRDQSLDHAAWHLVGSFGASRWGKVFSTPFWPQWHGKRGGPTRWSGSGRPNRPAAARGNPGRRHPSTTP